MAEMKNQKLLNKALNLLPDLVETKVDAVQTVELYKNDNSIVIEQAVDYRKRVLKKGNRVCLDFGNHQVGYLTLNLNYRGSHPDAPVWLKLHFAENATELFEDGKSYQGWICSSWIEEEQLHVDVVPSQLRLPRRYAFRYVMIEVLDISSKFDLVVEDAFCTAVSSAKDQELSAFKAQNHKLAKMDQIACRTLHNCMQQVFEDGPKRDRRLWMGDLRIQALTNYETYNNNDMVKACLYLFAALPMEKGRMGACLFLSPEPEVDDTLAEILRTAKAEQHKNRFRYGELYSLNYYSEVKEKDRTYYEVYSLPRTEEVPEGYKEISFVCLRPDGAFESPSTVGIMCRAARKKVDGLEDFHFHQLRHTFTSNLLSNGAAPKDVQELLGHADVSTTMNIYAHATREAKRTSARLLDKVVGGE